MARTPLLSGLQRAAADAHDATVAQQGHTRRDVLRSAGMAAAGATVLGRLATASPARAAGGPRIVVVGAGLAGLTAAYRLQQAGYAPQLYEASTRIGGRCWTIRNAFADGQIAEHGGELIDSGHTDMKQLAQELGFNLDNLLMAETNGTDPFHYFDGSPYSYVDATNDLKAIWQQIHSDVSAASYPTLYSGYTQRGWDLDHMSITDWIAAYVPGGTKSKLGQLLDVAYNIEYGAECSQQSALNMLYLLGYSGQGQLRIFGPSNEKWHVRGGNDQVPLELGRRLGARVVPSSELVAVRRGSSTWTLTFRQGTASKDVVADHVVLALPFSILRSSVDITKAGFSAVKRTAIAEQGMGTNSKLHVQFADRTWRGLGCNGETYADTGYQNTWEVSRAQPGASGILVNYTGGNVGTTFGSSTPQSLAKRFLGQIEPVLPGLTSRYNGRATVDSWPDYPWTKGSYSYWKVGQYTKFSGAEREAEGTCHFAGEHTSIDFQGYLNGAVESGQRASDEILADLKR